MKRAHSWLSALLITTAGAFSIPAQAHVETADELLKRLSSEVMATIKADPSIQAGDMSRVVSLVDSQILPNVNFTRMTASVVGRHWRQATPEQQQRLQSEFKTLLVRTYAGALGEVKDQTLNFKTMRSKQEDTEVVVRSEVRGRGEPIQLDYRMEKTSTGWKIHDINVLGVWLVDAYRTQFVQEISARGLDGLIATLVQRNRANYTRSSARP